MWLAEHVACMGESCLEVFLMGNLSKKDHLEDVGIGVTLIIIWILKQWNEEAWIGWI
jgi:hypothetical protein